MSGTMGRGLEPLSPCPWAKLFFGSPELCPQGPRGLLCLRSEGEEGADGHLGLPSKPSRCDRTQGPPGLPSPSGPSAKPCLGTYHVPCSFSPHVSLWKISYHPHITGRNTEVQRGEVTRPRSHSGPWFGGGVGWERGRCPVGGWGHTVTRSQS